jgi:hypothetical protein
VRKKCSSDRKKLLKFEAEGQEFAKILRSLEKFIQTVKGQNKFWYQNAFLTCYWRFFIYNKLEQLESKLEKNIGIQKSARKVRKHFEDFEV